MTVGRSPPRQAAPLTATEGGEGEQSAKQWDPREPPDKGLRPLLLKLWLTPLAVIDNGRREESPSGLTSSISVLWL